MQLVSSRETYHRITGARAKLSCASVWRDVVALPVRPGQGLSGSVIQRIRPEVPVMLGNLPIEQDILGLGAATQKYQFGPPANNLASATRTMAPIIAAAIL
jgi:hypothetical protein